MAAEAGRAPSGQRRSSGATGHSKLIGENHQWRYATSATRKHDDGGVVIGPLLPRWTDRQQLTNNWTGGGLELVGRQRLRGIG